MVFNLVNAGIVTKYIIVCEFIKVKSDIRIVLNDIDEHKYLKKYAIQIFYFVCAYVVIREHIFRIQSFF